MPTEKADPTKVVTGKVRLSYCNLWEPRASKGGEPKYGCVLLIPKRDKATMAKMRAAQEQALENGKSSKFNGSLPRKWEDTIHDGDEEADLERNPEYEGHWYVSVSTTDKPGIVDQDVNEILDRAEIYSGCYARASIKCAPFNYEGKKGVTFYLNNIQKVADGESLGGTAPKPEDDFEPLDNDDDGVI